MTKLQRSIALFLKITILRFVSSFLFSLRPFSHFRTRTYKLKEKLTITLFEITVKISGPLFYSFDDLLRSRIFYFLDQPLPTPKKIKKRKNLAIRQLSLSRKEKSTSNSRQPFTKIKKHSHLLLYSPYVIIYISKKGYRVILKSGS